MAEQYIYMAGGIGDGIFALPTIKALGGGIIISALPQFKYKAFKPLLESQSFIKEVRHVSESDIPKGHIRIDDFRAIIPQNKGMHLVNLHLKYFGFKAYDFSKGGWLEGDFSSEPPINAAIVNVTSRYRDRFFNWDKEIKYLKSKVGPNVYFMGLSEEYYQFCFNKNLGKYGMDRLRHWDTRNFLEAASVLARAKYFSGNQSAFLALRQSLGLPYRLEQATAPVDTTQHSSHETIINKHSRKAYLFCIGIKNALFDNF